MTTSTERPQCPVRYQAQPDTARRKGGGWAPGVSGNPNGRPKGSRNKKTLAVLEFEREGSAIAHRVVEAALAGDMQAANIALQRISPPLKARSEKVQFVLDPEGPLTSQAQQVVIGEIAI